jgi:molybdopterin synthase sulfur carrier subunit
MRFFRMRIQVRFFASLRERIGVEELELSLPEGTTVAQVWSCAVDSEPIPDNVLAARNMEHVDLSTLVADGDEIAFFPPVTGG